MLGTLLIELLRLPVGAVVVDEALRLVKSVVASQIP
jgi:hypothetical protein